MDSAQFIKLLTETEHALTRRKQNALVRGMWQRVIECEAMIKQLESLRRAVAGEDALKITEGFVKGYEEPA